MMRADAHQKVNAGHLKRNAYLYIRQSTLRQVFENKESTIRQYDLRQRAVALGWPVERIIVIDGQPARLAANVAIEVPRAQRAASLVASIADEVRRAGRAGAPSQSTGQA